jgi:plastocyanin
MALLTRCSPQTSSCRRSVAAATRRHVKRPLRHLLAAAVAGVAAVLIACGGPSSTAPSSTVPKSTVEKDKSGGTELATITAQNSSFSINSITAPAGAATIVTFQNNDSVAHTFTVFDGEDFTGEIVADSGPVPPSETSEVTVLFGRPGRHGFRCQIHPQLMKGVLVVE